MALKKMPLTVEAYHTILKKGVDAINPIILTLENSQDQYILGLTYKVIGDNMAFSFNRYANVMLLERTNVDLSMWFRSTKSLTTCPLWKVNSSIRLIGYKR